MKTIRVLLASRPKMLSDIIKNVVDSQPDMKVVAEVLDPIELLLAVKTKPVDVVILTPLDLEEEPRICRCLLEQNAQLKIVTLSAKGKTACLYQSDREKKHFNEMSWQSILGAIRASVIQSPEEKKA